MWSFTRQEIGNVTGSVALASAKMSLGQNKACHPQKSQFSDISHFKKKILHQFTHVSVLTRVLLRIRKGSIKPFISPEKAACNPVMSLSSYR